MSTIAWCRTSAPRRTLEGRSISSDSTPSLNQLTSPPAREGPARSGDDQGAQRRRGRRARRTPRPARRSSPGSSRSASRAGSGSGCRSRRRSRSAASPARERGSIASSGARVSVLIVSILRAFPGLGPGTGLAVRPGAYPLVDGDKRHRTRASASPSSGARCPTRPASTCSAADDGAVLYVGKARSIRKRVASHFSGAETELTRRVVEHRLPRHRDRGRGAARRAELHQAPPAALQHPPARRQVLPLRRDQPRRGLPARLLHPRAPPARPRLLRPLLERQAGARDPRPARQAVPVPHLRGPRAGPPLRQPLPRLLHQALRGALRRLRRPRGVPAQHRRDHRLPLRPLQPGRALRAGEDGGGRRRRRTSSAPPSTATASRGAVAVRAPARRRGVGRHRRPDRRRGRGHRRQRPGLPGPRRDPRRAPELLPRQPGRARAGRGRRGVHRPVLRGRADGAAADRRRPLPARAGAGCSPRRSASGAARRSRCGSPERGDKRRLRELAERNAKLALDQDRLRREHRRQRRVESLSALREALGMEELPVRIEGFDISNLGPEHTVASMVVFEGGATKKAHYRRFRVRGHEWRQRGTQRARTTSPRWRRCWRGG